jgi:hypothetical protein
MLEPTTAELTSCPNQPGNLPEHGDAIKEITMYRRRPPPDNQRPARAHTGYASRREPRSCRG